MKTKQAEECRTYELPALHVLAPPKDLLWVGVLVKNCSDRQLRQSKQVTRLQAGSVIRGVCAYIVQYVVCAVGGADAQWHWQHSFFPSCFLLLSDEGDTHKEHTLTRISDMYTAHCCHAGSSEGLASRE